MSETYGERVARSREDLGYSREEFAALSGVPERTLQDIELGKVERPQKRTRDKIDRALNLKPSGETESEWPSDLRAFLDLLGAYLSYLPLSEREAFIDQTIERMAHRD